MCSGCGTPPLVGHWADAGGANPADRLRIRSARAQVLARVLAAHHLTVRDGMLVPGLTLSASGGRQIIVPDLDALWTAAERLSGRAVDPLDDV
jgi:hypothetical protein